jgi:AcrR family transcriptional regulator
MPRPKKTEAEIQEMRQRIVKTALELLEENGIAAISSRGIAERMGIAHMSLFTYFNNQEAILEAVRREIVQRWQTRQAEFIERADHGAEIRGLVAELLDSYDRFALEQPNLFRMAWVLPEKALGDPEENRQNMRRHVETLAHLLAVGMQEGAFVPRDAGTAAAAVLGMIFMPHILFHTGKLVDPDLRDRLIGEMHAAAMLYLQTAEQ